MNKMIQIYSLIVGFSILDNVTCLKRFEASLSFLDHTLGEDELTNCDLEILGGSVAFYEEHYGRALISGSNGKLISKSEDIISKTKCLILVCNELTPLTDVIDIALSIQSAKPVGVIFEVMDIGNASKLINTTISFPLILEDAGAKIIFCPTVSKMRKTFSKFPRQGRCPNGKELMRGAEIPMSFAGGGPFLVRKDGKLIGGALVAIIDTLGTKYGFLSKLTPGKGVNKVTSSVSRRDFQVGMVTILYSPKMAQSVTYLTWMFEHEFIMYSLRPQEINNYLTLFLPFGPLLWLCIALTVICLIFALIITGEATSLMSIDFKGEGVSEPLNKSSQRKIPRNILITISLFFGFILGYCYKEKLVSSLVAKDYEKPIDTIQDLLDSGLKLHYPGGTPIARAIAIDPRDEIQQVMKNAEGFPFFGVFPSSVIEMVLNKTGVVLFPRAGNTKIVKPEFYNSKDVLFQPLLSMVLPKASPLRVPFNDALSWMQDTGILQKLLDTGYYTAYGKKSLTRYMVMEEQKTEPLRSQNMILVYFGLGISSFLSFVAFTLEARLWKKCGALCPC